ncbi:penicillin-binding protein 2 [bacterium]|nr:penicillin-binding protein 2 [bacterium]
MIEKERPYARLYLVFMVLALSFGAVVAKLAILQLTRTEKGLRAYTSLHSTDVHLTPVRGEIYDRRGLPLAVNRPETILIAEPFNIKNRPEVAAQLAPILKRPAGELLALMNDPRYRMYCRLAKGLDWKTIQEVMELRLAGLRPEEHPQRAYPQGSLAGSVVGFISEGTGVGGLERSYDRTLRGLPTTQKVTAVNQKLRMPDVDYSSVAGLRGADLVLTLDGYLQHVVEEELAAGVAEFSATSGTAILMDPHNGQVLAMAQYPPFDPNRPAAAPDKNLCVSDMFEPGSVMKPFTFAMAFEAGVLSESDVIDCENGRWRYSGPKVITDMHPKGRITAAEVLSESINIGTAKISALLMPQGKDEYALRDFLFKAGFGRPTGCGLPGESGGALRHEWWPIDRATVSYGHGISVTAMQLASRFAAFGNDGLIPQPHLVLGRRSPLTGDFFPEELPPPVRLVSPETARRVLALLHKVTLDGTGKDLKLPGYRFAGKTGTALIPDLRNGGYLEGQYIGSFVGFAPYPEPRFVLLVSLDRPVLHYKHTGKRNWATGGKTAGPVWTRMAERILHYLGVPPDPALLAADVQLARRSS